MPGAYVPGAYVPGAYVPGAYVPGAYVPGAYVPGAYVPGAYVPGAYVPGASLTRYFIFRCNFTVWIQGKFMIAGIAENRVISVIFRCTCLKKNTYTCTVTYMYKS